MTEPNRRLDFFANQDTQALTASFEVLEFQRTMDYVMVVNDDGGTDLEISFDGTTVHGVIAAGDPPMTFPQRRRARIYVRASSAIDYRVFAWLTAG